MLNKPGGSRAKLLIFDCDGVLVDSEVISAQVLCEVLRKQGLAMDEAFVFDRFLGRSMDSVREMLATGFSYSLSDTSLAEIRALMEARIVEELAAVPGVAASLERMPGPRCVASSSRPERIRLSLRVAGLLDFFEPSIFSATMVRAGKPAPDLFLHAAAAMGFRPDDCLVIEDSPAGVTAAKSAGMRVLGFVGGKHASASNLRAALAALDPDVIFDDMHRLPELLAEEPRLQ